jgi:hypothetical protein
MNYTNITDISTIHKQLTVEHEDIPMPVVVVVIFYEPARHRTRTNHLPEVAAA